MKAFKKILGALGAIVVLILVKMKMAAVYAVKVLVIMLLNMTLHRGDSTAVATRPKPPRQVAQATPAKNNPADKLAGPVAPAQSGSSAITPSAPLGAGPIQAARNAAAAQNAQLSKETGQAVSTAPTPTGTVPAAPANTAAPQKPAVPQNTPVVQQGGPRTVSNVAAAATANSAADANVMREEFDYARDTRRDPFVSLMTTSDLRPTLTDLRLTGILYDLSGRRPVAILRDVAGGQWRVTTGMTLGRMRVAQIRPKTIIFTIEEFGFNRQDSLILGDTTRVRRR